MEEVISFQRVVSGEEEGKYLSVPFSVPENVDIMEIRYVYDRENNIIDFGLVDASGAFNGWSGSNRTEITLSQWCESPGFAPAPIEAGEWSILLGAYKVAKEGVTVSYSVKFTMKKRQWLCGDTHIHSTGSDGKLTTDELAFLAKKQGLDYLFVTDHNNYSHNDKLISDRRLTMIPGVEWTHYKGHAGMLGRKRPFREFVANSVKEAGERLREAREEGAMIVLNHPFCPYCGWQWGMDRFPYDAVEIWNGALMIQSNLKCLEWWDERLKSGERITVIGGSDFHELEPGRMPALPCTCVYSQSRATQDILAALKAGNCFITLSPEGPMVSMEEEKAVFGEFILGGTELTFLFKNLREGDRIHLISREEREVFSYDGSELSAMLKREMPAKGYLRIEVRRKLLPDLGEIPIMVTNPFYSAE